LGHGAKRNAHSRLDFFVADPVPSCPVSYLHT
jgi:hypothetical protein